MPFSKLIIRKSQFFQRACMCICTVIRKYVTNTLFSYDVIFGFVKSPFCQKQEYLYLLRKIWLYKMTIHSLLRFSLWSTANPLKMIIIFSRNRSGPTVKIRKNAFGQVDSNAGERTWISIVEVDKNCQHRVFGIREVVEVLGNTKEFKLSRQSDKICSRGEKHKRTWWVGKAEPSFGGLRWACLCWIYNQSTFEVGLLGLVCLWTYLCMVITNQRLVTLL